MVLGLDVGRSFGWAVVDYDLGTLVDAGTTTIGPKRPPKPKGPTTAEVEAAHQRAVEAAEAEFVANTAAIVADLALAWEPIGVGIEGPFIHAAHLAGSAGLLKQHGAVLVALWRHGHAPATVQPSTLKKWSTGHGGATKDAMGLAAAARWGTSVFGLGPDAIDALWVAAWAREAALTHWGSE